ncbi:MAG: DUF2189 domain-containing protein [Rhodomicrobiaceae bacterium]
MSDTEDRTYDIPLTAIKPSGAIVHDTIHIARVDVEAPWRWLSAGWSDLLAMPHISLAYGAVFAAVAIGLWFGLSTVGWQSLMLALAGGFMLIGPVLAVGLYEASRRREAGLPIKLRDIIFAGFKAPGQLSLLGLTLLLIYMVWVQIALLLFMMFFGSQPFPPIDEFVPHLLFTWRGVTLLVVGSAVGAAIAFLVFAICVVSVPMLMARPVGATTAIFASLRATILNIMPMALWAALIAGFVAVGLGTLCLGLIVIFPLIGHASWHAYRDVLGRQ